MTSLALVFHSLYLSSITIPSASPIFLMRNSDLSLASSLSLTDAISLYLRSLHPPNMESSLQSSSTSINFCSLRLSSVSFLASDLQLLASLMSASILAQNSALAFSNLLAALCLRALLCRSLIPYISPLVPYILNNHSPPPPPNPIFLYSNYCPSCLLIPWWPAIPFQNEKCSIS